MKRYLFLPIIALTALASSAQSKGGIDNAMLNRISQSYQGTQADKALRNAMLGTPIDQLALNAENANDIDTNFSHKVDSKGITNQKSSGRCWAFTGLNVLRAQMMANNDLPKLTLSQNYLFFYDQLEKANLFLQGVIDTADLPMEDRQVDWLFNAPISDGGTYAGVADLVMKYGVVPTEIMRETQNSEATSKMRQLVGMKLRKEGLKLREMAANKADASQLAQHKEQVLGDVYRMLVMAYGQPPQEFTWTRRNSKGEAVDTRKYTPKSFYNEYAGQDLLNDYIMVMNDPTREYWKLYEIDYDRHVYDGVNWTYINLPIEEVKKLAIESIKDSTMMYFSCDVSKQLDRKRGYMDLDNFDYEALLGVDLSMNKKERIMSHASASSHAMTLMAVDLDENGKPIKWMVENSWGDGANGGHLIMTDDWFDEYMFRLAVNKKYADKKVLNVLKQQPIKLPSWDYMFAIDE